MRKVLAAAVVLAGIGGYAASGWAASFTEPTLVGGTLITPFVSGGSCIDGDTETDCNSVHRDSGGIGDYDGVAGSPTNPEGLNASNERAEIWYLDMLIDGVADDQYPTALSDPTFFDKTEVGGDQTSGSINTANWTYAILKWANFWSFVELSGDELQFSGLRNALSHYVLVGPVPIPLPAAAWMLLAGLAVLFGVGGARKRRAAS